ncbi:ribosome-binding protein hypothetical protein [Limosa lapponica baueri]|uniref:Ribosome-binding protein 1 n=1 Tax=Limosa lapponica baueri TaxID=1758121 RepID=A0A2I0T7K3_LIMLA|nr:ribosome-binding protein hypothetical protein [Limosa lapponica baueri]
MEQQKVKNNDYDTWLQEFKEKTVEVLKQQTITTELPDSALKLKEAEEAQSTLQAECEQYRAILAETEGMLRNLQKSVEEEEQVWKAKLTASEEELQKVRQQLSEMKSHVQDGEVVGLQADPSEPAPLEERLEKEKKLTKDLGQAATKLQELLKVTQDQLAKERETVKKLKEQLQETGEEDSSKEGTSV